MTAAFLIGGQESKQQPCERGKLGEAGACTVTKCIYDLLMKPTNTMII